jgi:hypothetical protein
MEHRTKESAVKIYESEMEIPPHLDLGLVGPSRALLRTMCRNTILEASQSIKRKYSYSALSSRLSGISVAAAGDVRALLKQLQKERLVVTRLGFPERAMEIDAEIERILIKVKRVTEKEEADLLEYRLKMLKAAQKQKRSKLVFEMEESRRKLEEQLKEEYENIRARHKHEFVKCLDDATRRATGQVKKCVCMEFYLCKHNKVSSYNTRKPTKVVVQYRRNGKRLRQSGRPEEGQAWDEKAAEIDASFQEKWRDHIATAIVSSAWGANGAIVDKVRVADAFPPSYDSLFTYTISSHH